MAVFAEELQDVAGVFGNTVPIAVVTIDEDKQTSGVEINLSAFVVTGRCADTTLSIAVDRQAMDVNHAATDTLVGFTFASDAECQRITNELIGIKAAYAITIGNGCQVDEVDEGVDLIEFLTLQHTSDKSFRGRTIARRIFTTGLIDSAGSGNATHVL